MLQTEHSLSTGLRRTRLSLPLGTQGPVPAVGLKPQERRASARRSCEKDGQNEGRRVKSDGRRSPHAATGGNETRNPGYVPTGRSPCDPRNPRAKWRCRFRGPVNSWALPPTCTTAGSRRHHHSRTVLCTLRMHEFTRCSHVQVYRLHVGRDVDLCNQDRYDTRCEISRSQP